MPGALEAVDGILAQADSGAVTASEAIEDLLSAQIVLRNNRRLQAAMRSSRLPAVKTLDQFDFSFQPSIKREQIESLHELGFLERAENVIVLGPPGVGKTHLAISLAIAAAESGRKVYYGTLAALIESLAEAKAAGNLSRRLRVLTHPALLVVDEIGYLPISQDGAVLFFQLINARHERASTVLTSNKRFEEWGGVLGDEIIARPSSTACCITATSSTSEATATGCEHTRTSFALPPKGLTRRTARDQPETPRPRRASGVGLRSLLMMPVNFQDRASTSRPFDSRSSGRIRSRLGAHDSELRTLGEASGPQGSLSSRQNL